MNVGLPGTGLAGLFYLLAALWMPCHELGRTLRGERDPARWRVALTQAGLAAGILAAIVATAWVSALLLSTPSTPASEGPGAEDAPVAPAIRILGIVPSPLTFVTVAIVILLLEAVALVIARRRGRAISAH